MHAYRPTRARTIFGIAVACSLFRFSDPRLSRNQNYILFLDRPYVCIMPSHMVGVVARGTQRKSPDDPGRSLSDNYWLVYTCKAAGLLANDVRYACHNILYDMVPHDEQTIGLLYVIRVTQPCCFAVPNHRCQMRNPIFINYNLVIFVPLILWILI
jgi:hypothetical protein